MSSRRCSTAALPLSANCSSRSHPNFPCALANISRAVSWHPRCSCFPISARGGKAPMEQLSNYVRRTDEWTAPARMALAVVAVLTVIAIAAAARADVKPGDVITAANASKGRDLVSPGGYYKVENGMSMKIVPSGQIDWPPPYKAATEKNS